MVRYLLDTSVIISALRGSSEIQQKICEVGIQNCAISELTMAELYIGPLRILENLKPDSPDYIKKSMLCKAQLDSIELLLSKFAVLPWSGCSFTFAKIHEELRAAGTPVDDFDLMIGVQAKVGRFIMVTANERHFCRIPELVIENWN